jgi:hypothetical protein
LAKEDTANKSTSVVTDQASDVKFPSVKAVYDGTVSKTSTTGSAILPSGTTAQEVTGNDGYLRFDSTLGVLRVWYSAAWNTIATTANAVLTTGAQTIAGVKTFSSPVVIEPATAQTQAIQGSQLFGFRNKIINGNFTALQVINQRGSAARNTTSNAYNFDRWFYHSTNTTLTQAIESLSLQPSTVYTVNWSGTATCEYIQSASAMATVVAAGGWTSIAKGGTLTTSATTVSSGLHLFIRFVGVDATLATLDMVQVEQGSLATPFEHRPYGLELALCQRYYEKATGFTFAAYSATGAYAAYKVMFQVTKRASPSVTVVDGTTVNCSGSVFNIQPEGFHIALAATATGMCSIGAASTGSWVGEKEL